MNVNGRAISTTIPNAALDLIGNTPILELRRIRELLKLHGRLLVKLEHVNPGGSNKDRVPSSMIQAARADGRLIHGQPAVEVTSGNTGTGLAIVCRGSSPRMVVIQRLLFRRRTCDPRWRVRSRSAHPVGRAPH